VLCWDEKWEDRGQYEIAVGACAPASNGGQYWSVRRSVLLCCVLCAAWPDGQSTTVALPSSWEHDAVALPSSWEHDAENVERQCQCLRTNLLMRARLARCMYVLNVGDEQGEVCLVIVEAVCPRQPASIENCRGNSLVSILCSYAGPFVRSGF
jgi:hypothetical protein